MTDRTTTNPETPADSAPELIERYVREVARRLPAKQRADVVRELRSTLLDALEDRFGPAPTWTHAAILLREYGPPKKVAASYRPEDRYLIGPEWFPAFSLVVRIVLAALSGALVLASALALVTRPAGEIGGILLGLVEGLVDGGLIAFAIVVGVFHLLQRTEKPPVEFGEGWDPAELPPATECDAVGRGEAIAGVVVPPIFLGLLYLFRDVIGVPVPGGGPPLLNDVFLVHLPWLAASALAGMAVHAVLVWRHRWGWATRAANLAADLFALWVLSRIALDVAAERAALAAAGMPEGVIQSIGWIVWSVPAAVGLAILLETGKVAACHLRQRTAAA